MSIQVRNRFLLIGIYMKEMFHVKHRLCQKLLMQELLAILARARSKNAAVQL